MSVEQEVQEVIVQTLSVKPEEIKKEQSLYDCLGIDSTEIVDLRIALEKKFAVKIDAKEITKFISLKDIISIIENKRSFS